MESIITLRTYARHAGLLYFALALTGAYGIMYVPLSVIVANDPGATAANILANEFFFRSGIFSNLAGQTIFLFLGFSLYRLFKQVDDHLAKILVGLIVASVPVAYFIIFNQFSSLILLKDSYLSAFDTGQQQAMALAFMNMYSHGLSVIGIFWGLWLIPFGMLVYKSGFIPRLLGVLLVVGGLSYVIDASVVILAPGYRSWTSAFVGIASSLAEFSAVIWLVVVGVREPKGQPALHKA